MRKFRKYIVGLLSVLFFSLAVLFESQTLNKHPEVKLIQAFQKTLLDQEAKLSGYLNRAELKIDVNLSAQNSISTFAELNGLFEEHRIGLLVFKDRRMIYWSSNQFAFPNILNKFSTQNCLLTLPNGIYLAQKRVVGSFELVGLILIRNNYSYENQFLENSFVSPFNLPSDFILNNCRDEDTFEIHDRNNQYLFSILPAGTVKFGGMQLYFPAALYLLGFLFLLIAVYRYLGRSRSGHFAVRIGAVLAGLLVFYALHIKMGLPLILKHIVAFSAQYYAISSWLPSFGDFFLITVMLFYWCLIVVGELKRYKHLHKKIILPAFLFVGLLYQLVGVMIESLISNSNIVFKLTRITDINQYSVGGYLAIALLLFSVFIIHLRVIEQTPLFVRTRNFLRIHCLILLLSIALCCIYPSVSLFLLVLFLSVNLLQSQIKRLHISLYSLAYSILFISLFSIISLLVIYHTVKIRDFQIQKLFAANLSSEHDPVAEVYLARMQKKIDNDTIIPSLLTPPYKELESYLTRTYFSGYFRKFDIQYPICAGNDSILVQPENISEPCFPYFEKMIAESGVIVPGSSFYIMNNMNGRISYLGKLHYPQASNPNGISVFIDIKSKAVSEGIGFPELLMDRSLLRPVRYKYLSYAKYYDEELVNYSGEYAYNFYLQSYPIKSMVDEIQFQTWDGYGHLIYRSNGNSYVVVSSKLLTPSDYLTSFPYLFVFYFVFVLFFVLLGKIRFLKLIIPNDLRFRIQLAIISVVLGSLVFVATGTIYYNIKEYRERHQSDLQEKIKSVSEEIRSRMLTVNSITPEIQQWLPDELYKLSNIFRTDINIYDIRGELLVSSRPEIYDKGLTSERMNAAAFYELSERYQLSYFQPEKIGKLSYLSAYEPIINNKGDYLGYLNLPYFTREDDLKQAISTFVVAFINLYLLLFLASVIVAVVLSDRITQPLSLIREKLKGIQLGKKSEQISYKADDEIGALVREYNHKVDELAESADLLARSERESAWREMAKQVAHEIKNPLTPMKLNIQYLQRAKAEKNEHYDEFFERVTRNLIEQIDTLSGIATEFSNFAKIPKAKNEVFNLIEVIQNVQSLFESSNNLQFFMDFGGEKDFMVLADKEQLSRVFLNLVKNAIQAIPAETNGEIRIWASKLGSKVQVSIQDNGVGISKEAQEHLFEPNFTTKNSGMGLGLSIVRNIIEAFQGRIWYETSESYGTTFYIEIPLYAAT